MPPSAGLPRFDHRADVTGIGLVALALVLGRPLHAARIPESAAGAAQRGARAHGARRRAAAVAAAARLAGARAAARHAPRVCLGARGADRARRDRRGRLDVRRGAGRARDVPLALHRGAARAADGEPMLAAPTATVFMPPASAATVTSPSHAGRRERRRRLLRRPATGRVCAASRRRRRLAPAGRARAFRCAASRLRAGRACCQPRTTPGPARNSGGLRFRGARYHRPDLCRRSEGDP